MEKRKWNGGEEWEINLGFMQIYKMRGNGGNGEGRNEGDFGNKNMIFDLFGVENGEMKYFIFGTKNSRELIHFEF